eukprot:TRINITY_DN21705_c1_g1_i1.p1 TRINITY_DN21705_c1_g1~~TRINITY_DN21705_c1_g1_i1.p1  ORF type:complete len:354 (+),score=84.22 TRINITY_DN21705_c1_g1_i1:185-1246(+)
MGAGLHCEAQPFSTSGVALDSVDGHAPHDGHVAQDAELPEVSLQVHDTAESMSLHEISDAEGIGRIADDALAECLMQLQKETVADSQVVNGRESGDELKQSSTVSDAEVTATAVATTIKKSPVKKKAKPKASTSPTCELAQSAGEKPEKATPKVEEFLAGSFLELEVTIFGTRNLRGGEGVPGGTAPYCVCQSMGSGNSKFTTPLSSNREEPDPVWNYTNRLIVSHGQGIRITIFDKVFKTKDQDMMGYAETPFSKICRGMEDELKLRATTAALRAIWKVQTNIVEAVKAKQKPRMQDVAQKESNDAFLKISVKVLRAFSSEEAAVQSDSAGVQHQEVKVPWQPGKLPAAPPR